MIAAIGDISGIQNGQWPAIDKFENPQLLASLLNAGLDPNITDRKWESNPLPMRSTPRLSGVAAQGRC